MNKPKLVITRKRYLTKAGKTFVVWVLVFAASGCGASIGNSAFGTTEFMERHNAKVRILHGITEQEVRHGS
jgi:hypothetical protein